MNDALSAFSNSSILLSAVQWLQGTFLGTFATTVAIIAIAWIGLGMLTGRVNLQRGATTILGCFIVFGAPTIAAGLMKLGATASPERASVAAPPLPLPSVTPTFQPYDPYAGASVPTR